MKAPAGKAASEGADNHRPPAQEIADQMIDLIESDVFAPGERLREQDLADRFGVTRGRIREVLHTLEARGFVSLERMKGATIIRYDVEEVVAIAQIRAALMALAVKRAAEDGSTEEKAAIVRQGAELARTGTEMSAQEFRAATIELADLICNAAHSSALRRLIDDAHRMPSGWRAYRNIIVADRNRRVWSGKRWKAVAEAIKKGDSDKATSLVDEIYRTGLQNFKELIAASGQS